MGHQGHDAFITTLASEAYDKVAPEVSFVRKFPGVIESGIARRSIGGLANTLVHIPLIEAGDRYLLLCTNACFSTEPEDSSIGVPLVDGLALAKGTDSQIGSDVYPIDTNSESARPSVDNLLAELRSQGMVERV